MSGVKSLVIVESPAKVKSIAKFLGPDFVVKSSVGHVRDLASVGSDRTGTRQSKTTPIDPDAKLYQRMGVFPLEGWRAHYAILSGKEKVVRDLQRAARDAHRIYLATDLDREGEAIAWHLMQALGGDPQRYLRVTFTEITAAAVRRAFDEPGRLSMSRVHAQQARRFLDRIVGFMVSPVLWQKIARGLSAGRVQSVAVRLVSEREREIHAFKPEEYWSAEALLSHDEESLATQVHKMDGIAYRPVCAAESEAALSRLSAQPVRLRTLEQKASGSKPPAPFITSTLQQAASTRLGFGVKKTMTLAQGLYEQGLITYMRTDSTNLSDEAVAEVRRHIERRYGSRYLPQQPQKYASKKSAQEAHEAIRPTDVGAEPSVACERLDPDHRRLYDLIRRQFIACQMVGVEFHSTTMIFEAGPFELRARGRVITFDGYYRVQPPVVRKDVEDRVLPSWGEGTAPQLAGVTPRQHFTPPPPRYSEASLVRELEKRGIGRPSTYATIISTIQERGYVRTENRRFFCLKMGEIVTDRLAECFTDLMDYGFTAGLEERLDAIAAGQQPWQEVLDAFYQPFLRNLESARVGMRPSEPVAVPLACRECGRSMQVRIARTGVFLSCSGYALTPKERCRSTQDLMASHEIAEDLGAEEGDAGEVRAKRRCPQCDFAMDGYLVDARTKLHLCGNSPDCRGTELEAGNFKLKGCEGPVLACDRCGMAMQLRSGRFGKYFACTAGESCKNTRKLLKSGEVAPPKSTPVPMPELPCTKSDGYFVLRDGAAGLFLASSAFPRSRETRKPEVADLVRHRAELDPKYQYLCDAPAEDPEGRTVVVRYSRKHQEHYVGSEQGGKPTKWQAIYRQGVWRPGAPGEG